MLIWFLVTILVALLVGCIITGIVVNNMLLSIIAFLGFVVLINVFFEIK